MPNAYKVQEDGVLVPICHLGRVVERVPGLGRLGDELLGRLWQTYLHFLLRAFSRIIPFILEDARPWRDATCFELYQLVGPAFVQS